MAGNTWAHTEGVKALNWFMLYHVNWDQNNRQALIDAAGVDPALVDVTDFLNVEAMKHRSLLHSAKDKITSSGFQPVWPVPITFFSEMDMIDVRGTLDLVYVPRELPPAEACAHCRPHLGVHVASNELEVKCISDPVERDGCYRCVRKGLRCGQEMSKENDFFVFWPLALVLQERLGADAFVALLQPVFATAESLVLRFAGPQHKVWIRVSRRLLLGTGGVKEAAAAWTHARQWIGRENRTSIADREGANHRHVRR